MWNQYYYFDLPTVRVGRARTTKEVLNCLCLMQNWRYKQNKGKLWDVLVVLFFIFPVLNISHCFIYWFFLCCRFPTLESLLKVILYTCVCTESQAFLFRTPEFCFVSFRISSFVLFRLVYILIPNPERISSQLRMEIRWVYG